VFVISLATDLNSAEFCHIKPAARFLYMSERPSSANRSINNVSRSNLAGSVDEIDHDQIFKAGQSTTKYANWLPPGYHVVFARGYRLDIVNVANCKTLHDHSTTFFTLSPSSPSLTSVRSMVYSL